MLDVIEERMKGALAQSRAMFAHLGVRGSVVESEFREVLAKQLPRSLTVGAGEVIDLHGRRSGQMDVLVANQEQPFQYDRHEPGIYIVEGVAAGGEVKSNLTTDRLTEAIKHGSIFKTLRTRAPGRTSTAIAAPEDVRKFYECPPYFVFAFETDVNQETLIDRLVEAKPVHVAGSAASFAPVDAVFVLGRGLALNYGNGHGAFRTRLRVGGESRRAAGWMWRDSESAFGEFALWLHTVMPRPVYLYPVAPTYLGRRTIKDASVTGPPGSGWESLELWNEPADKG